MVDYRYCSKFQIPSCCNSRPDYISLSDFNFPEFNADYRCKICQVIINKDCEFPRVRLNNREYTFCKVGCYNKWLLKKK